MNVKTLEQIILFWRHITNHDRTMFWIFDILCAADQTNAQWPKVMVFYHVLKKILTLKGGSNISDLQTLETSRLLFPYRCKLICFCRKRKSTRLKWARSRLHIRRRNRNLADTSISVPFNDRLVLCLPCDKKMSISRDLKSHVWVIHRLGLFSPRLSHVNLSLSTEP